MQSKRYTELECIDASLCISAKNIKIQSEDVEKINRAWSEGHTVVVSFNSWYNSPLTIEIRTVNNTTQLQRWEKDITQDWKKVAQVLSKGHLPQEWMQLIEDIGRGKEHVCI